jgi:tRNA threonylcarbamoyl adenosine modification protein (Sua5/YciO/YrdC/YwlC family)
MTLEQREPGTVLRAHDPDEMEAALQAASDALARGRLVGLPTETVYGLACALNDEALEHLLRAKGRPRQKGITILVDSLDQAATLAELPAAARRLAERFWPGPLTLVVPARVEAGLPMLLTGPRFTVGLRLPDHPVPRALARRLGPLPLTSANRSGEPDATEATAVVEALGELVAVVIDTGPSAGGVPSTVVAVGEAVAETEGQPAPVLGGTRVRVLRVGALTQETIESALR